MKRKLAALLAALLLVLGAMSGCGKNTASSGNASAGNAYYYASGGNASSGNASSGNARK